MLLVLLQDLLLVWGKCRNGRSVVTLSDYCQIAVKRQRQMPRGDWFVGSLSGEVNLMPIL